MNIVAAKEIVDPSTFRFLQVDPTKSACGLAEGPQGAQTFDEQAAGSAPYQG
jgi:hypothetical protein